MSRSGYTDDCWDDDGANWRMICYRGAVASAIRGKRGQAFLREMIEALDALPEKRLIAEELRTPEGDCCAMGAVAIRRGVDVSDLDPWDKESVAFVMGISVSLAREIAFENDENGWSGHTSPEARWSAMRRWAEGQLNQT